MFRSCRHSAACRWDVLSWSQFCLHLWCSIALTAGPVLLLLWTMML
jgi:hypothetical protein